MTNVEKIKELDLVNLLETNPIIKLSETYSNKLLNKIKETFTNYEQKLFVTSFYCYINYNSKNDYNINIDNIWKWLGFSNKDKAVRLLKNKFKENDDYILNTPTGEQVKKHGGHNKIIILLNIRTFKSFCLKAGTAKASEIHDYFIKLEELLHEITYEESNEHKLQLEQKDKFINKELNKTKQIEKQNIMLLFFANKSPLVYIICVKTFDNGSYVIKIGETRKDINLRFNDHKSNYEECILLDCFSVKRSKDFESFLHNHPNIKNSRVKDLENHTTEKELFLIGDKLTYPMLTNIINNSIKNYDDYREMDLEKDKLEIEKLKLIKDVNNMDDKKINLNNISSDNYNNLVDKIDNLEKLVLELKESSITSQTRTTNNFNEPLVAIGPRIQQINPDTLKLVKYYEAMTECLRLNPNLKRSSINKAINENIIYQGFRWMAVDRELDPNVINNIEQTKKIINKRTGYIAKLNKDKTFILNVYIDRKTAAVNNNYKSPTALDGPFKNKTITREHYYVLYEECEQKLIDAFVKKIGQEPLLYRDGIGQFDLNNKLIKEFPNKFECCRMIGMSDKTLKKSLTDNKSYNKFFYKTIPERLFC